MSESKISNHHTRGGTTIHGWPAILFGLLFVAVGTFIILVSLDVIPADDSSFNAPRWVVTVCGAIFAAPGLLVMSYGVRSMARHRRWKHMILQRPDEPWHADYEWDPRVVKSSTIGRSIRYLFTTAIFAAFMIPFNWWAFISDDSVFMVVLITSLFDLITVCIFLAAIYHFIGYMKYGTSRLELEQFPYFLGEPFRARFTTGKTVNTEHLKFTLRCVEERHETRKTSDGNQTSRVAYKVYGETKSLPISGRTMGRYETPIEFDLPPDPHFCTRLKDNPPIYWELMVEADTPGVDFFALFLIPVYSRDPVST